MTTVGLLHPGHWAEDDYPRLEVLLDSDIRLVVVDAEPPDGSEASGAAGGDGRLAAGVEELRLAGAESVVWTGVGGSPLQSPEEAHRQIRGLARAAGLPASSTSFGFVHAVRRLGAARVAVAAAHSGEATAHFTEFLRASGVEVATPPPSGGPRADEYSSWGRAELLELARAADRPGADVLLIPDPALHTVAHLPELEEAVGKPVLTAHQVTVWEGLRLADHRAWALRLGALFAKPES
ncbi:decarboxylase [Streptomyces inusitatus]|uniref:Decarboxylase n=1 Tax=Streptomyces inusitatus TaxID=68221 RepID=A0A918QKP8_9ACTN|nr:decarboxylase [Streptomyces inusitatus]GGZ57125.1 decarboxylase [Streptomyces inusitatus]